MFVLFEEDGGFKVGSLLSQAEASVQVEMASGKRVKVKRAALLLEFESPAPDVFMQEAQATATELDPDFLWQCAPKEEFNFQEFSADVFGATASARDKAGLLMALYQAPMFFYRKGRGRFRAADPDALKAALAGAERKRLAAEAQQAFHDALVAGQTPAVFYEQALSLLIKPDKQSVTYKALESAAHALQMTPARLLLERGALPSVYSLHHARFMQQCFPHGLAFPVTNEDILGAAEAATALKLPLAEAQAYSIDDASTTEIDDAFSIVDRPEGGWRVGIHIAAPGLGIAPESPMGQMVKERASTVYFPGDKITMLPASVIAAYSLDEGQARPALSLYVDFDAAGQRVGSQSRVERVLIAANLRLGDWESVLEQPIDEIDEGQLPWAGIKPMLRLAEALRRAREESRGRPEPAGRVDFNFYVDWNPANPEARLHGDGQARLVARRRGSPIDVLVSEFMILANTAWGDTLALARLPGVYRVQSMGRVRMQTQPGPHQGLGVQNYAWCTSPLRRFSDLLNQWQLLSVLGHRSPVFKGNEAELFSVVTQFDTAYNQYADFQDTLERYWSLRWLASQAGLADGESWSLVSTGRSLRETAVALREGAFRLRRVPIVFRCPDAPELAPGLEIEVDLLAADALDLELQARFVSVMSSVPDLQEPIMAKSEHYAVLGDPISHSRSPWIHHQFAIQTGQTLHYEAIRVSPETLQDVLMRLIDQGFGGVNLTLPLKTTAFALAASLDWEVSSRAQLAGAINTLRFDPNGFVYADNTDGLGLVADLERLMGHAGGLEGRRILLLGAGGAAQGVIGPLRAAGARHIVIANRTFASAEALVRRWTDMDGQASEWLSAVPMDVLADPVSMPAGAAHEDFIDDIIINATSASISGAVLAIDPSRLRQARLVLDMMYGPQDTPFMAQARAAQAALVADGLGMLVEQAAEAFHLWRGQRPDTAPVLAQLRLQLSA